MVEAFNIAETFRTPVALLFDEVVGHMRERLELPEAGEIALVDRLRTAVGDGVDDHPVSIHRATHLLCYRAL